MVEVRSRVVVRVGDFGVFGGVVRVLEEIRGVTTLVLFFVQHLKGFLSNFERCSRDLHRQCRSWCAIREDRSTPCT